MDLKGIKNIIFDLGGVIINIDHQLAFSAFQHLLGNKFDSLEKQLLHENILERYETAAITTDEFVSFFQAYNSGLTEQSIINAWNSMLLEIPKERMDLIIHLTKKYRVFLLSNTNEIHLKFINEYVREHFGLWSVSEPFEKAYYSNEMKLRKPNAEIFKQVLNVSKLLPKETLFIDDTEEHIITAKQLNLKTHHLLSDETILDLFDED